MKFTLPLFLLLVVSFPIAIPAAPRDTAVPEPAGEIGTETAEADPGEGIMPERETEFEHSEETRHLKMFRADPKLLEQKYSATVRFVFSEGHPSVDLLPADLRDLSYYQTYYLFDYRRRAKSSGPPKEFFRRLATNLPDDKMPDQEALAFFTGEEVNTGYLQFSADRELFEFIILAPTAELAQQRAEALVKLLDYGLTQPIQSHLLREKRQLQEEVTGYEERIEEAQERVAEYQQQLQDTESISAEELSALKTQQRLLAVDLAGTKARIEAADKLLSDGRALSVTRIDRIENVKITAEIELAGLSGRQKTLNEMIEQAEQRLALVGKMRDAQAQIRLAENKKSQANKRIRILNEAIEFFGPLPLHEGKIVIQPIQWGG